MSLLAIEKERAAVKERENVGQAGETSRRQSLGRQHRLLDESLLAEREVVPPEALYRGRGCGESHFRKPQELRLSSGGDLKRDVKKHCGWGGSPNFQRARFRVAPGLAGLEVACQASEGQWGLCP